MGRTVAGAPNSGRVKALGIRNGVIVAAGMDRGICATSQHTQIRGSGWSLCHGWPQRRPRSFRRGGPSQAGSRSDRHQPRSRTCNSGSGRRPQRPRPGAWLEGGGWDHTLWENKVTPTRADLDSVTGNHPAIFSRIDGHIAVANSAALAAAGISRETPDPQGGKIDRDGQGEATGILREDSAMNLVFHRIPAPSEALRRRGLELAIADAFSHGLTSVQDNSDWEDFLVFEKLEQEGKLTLRVTEWLPFNAPVEQLEKMRSSHDAHDRMLNTGMLKGFMDGSLGSRTAAMKEPFADDPRQLGHPAF